VTSRYATSPLVGEDLSRQAGDAVVIGAAGTIAVPGFIGAHVHAWEGQLRGAAPVLDFGGYLGFIAFGYGPATARTTTTSAPSSPPW
jgi:cytosine/adenosine deaminase-related metal-dependent hydrolase